MAMLIAAAAVFLAIHFLISGTRVRDVITGAIGEGPYLGMFSLASLAAIVWLAISYNHANGGPDDRQLYALGPAVFHLAIPIVALAFFIGVQGLLGGGPTRVRGTVTGEETIHGVFHITRHPFLWSVVLWSGFHVAANGNLASVIFFGTFFVLALFGTFLIDAKRKRKLGDAWNAFARKTSNIPFAAIVSGRTRLALGEDFGWRFWVAALIFVAVLFSHARLFGVSPFPNGWRPF